MSNQPPYIGPYTAEYYDQVYGAGALFTMPQPEQEPERERGIINRWDPSGFFRLDLIIFATVAIAIAGLAFYLYKKNK